MHLWTAGWERSLKKWVLPVKCWAACVGWCRGLLFLSVGTWRRTLMLLTTGAGLNENVPLSFYGSWFSSDASSSRASAFLGLWWGLVAAGFLSQESMKKVNESQAALEIPSRISSLLLALLRPARAWKYVSTSSSSFPSFLLLWDSFSSSPEVNIGKQTWSTGPAYWDFEGSFWFFLRVGFLFLWVWDYCGLTQQASKHHTAFCSLPHSGTGERLGKKVECVVWDKDSLTGQKKKVK